MLFNTTALGSLRGMGGDVCGAAWGFGHEKHVPKNIFFK